MAARAAELLLPGIARTHALPPAPTLPPSAIVGAAWHDIRLRVSKAEGFAAAWAPYAFHRAHVARSANAIELITAARKERLRGLVSGKHETRLIYGDDAALAAALEMALAGGRG